MRILIAEDDVVSRRLLEATLRKWDFEVVVTCDGEEAWAVLQQEDAPALAILDWMMPGLDGLEVCCRLRALNRKEPTYLILLTAKSGRDDLVAGLRGGADDYVIKPFDREELHARLHVGLRIVALQRSLAQRVRDLEDAFARVKHLQGLLPICCYCKKIRNDDDYWQQLESYIMAHTEARFSHGICPDCFEAVVKPELNRHTSPTPPREVVR